MLMKRLQLICTLVLVTIGWSWSIAAHALTFPLPPSGDSLVGKVQWTQARPGDTFSLIGRRYDIGYYQLVEANPGLDPDNLAPGTIIVIPSQFVLPAAPRTGVVINLPELRIYYYPAKRHVVMTFPIGIGRQNWNTPLGINRITTKEVNPTWVVPDSIRADRAKDGIYLPKSVPPGPDNPLGAYRMRLSQPTYLIHGTNDYTGIGRRSSSGCIRMLPEDVEVLFSQVRVNTQVNIISQPYKAGWKDQDLYLEAHVPLQEEQLSGPVDLATAHNTITNAIQDRSGELNWRLANRIAQVQNGVPQIIGRTS